MSLNFFKKTKETEQTERLEDKVMRFMKKVSLLQEEQPKLAYRFLQQATKLYHNKLGSYIPEIDSEFNQRFLSFFEMYPLTRNPKLIKILNPPHQKSNTN